MAKKVTGSGTKQAPWQLTTPSGTSEYQMYKDEAADPPALVCMVGKTELRYQLRAIEDLQKMLKANGDWVPLGSADEQKPAAEGTVEAWGRSAKNPVGGWYGLRKGYRGATACIHPCLSGAAPRWISTSADLSRMVIAPGLPSPTVHEPRADFAAPTGVITAAVPQAKTSVSEPSAQPACHCSTLMRPSSTSYPRSRPSVSSASRVTPASNVPVSSGVMTLAFEPVPKTKNRFMPPISSIHRCSMASSHTT
jgi:hypothetical protein